MDNRRSSVRSTSPLIEGESPRTSIGDIAEVAEQPAESRVATVAESNAGAMARARAASKAEAGAAPASKHAAAASSTQRTSPAARSVSVVSGTPIVPGEPLPDVEAGAVAGSVHQQIHDQLSGRRYRVAILAICAVIAMAVLAVGRQSPSC